MNRRIGRRAAGALGVVVVVEVVLGVLKAAVVVARRVVLVGKVVLAVLKAAVRDRQRAIRG